jgi:phosphatidylglycerophosphate synthase
MSGRKIDRSLENPVDDVLLALSDRVSSQLHKLNVVPNQITMASLLSGLISAYLIYQEMYVPASILFFVSYFFDCLDGYYARKYDLVSEFGHWFDKTSDFFKLVLIAYSLYRNDPERFLSRLIILVPLFLSTFVHLKCQDHIYQRHRNKGVGRLEKLFCPDSNIVKYTRLFGCGTFYVAFMIVIMTF